MGIYVQKMAKNDGHDLLEADNSSKRRGRKLKNGGGGKRTTVNAPRGPKREKTGGVGVTLGAVSNGQMIRNNTVPISEADPF